MELQSGLLQDIKVGQSCSVKECSVEYWVLFFMKIWVASSFEGFLYII